MGFLKRLALSFSPSPASLSEQTKIMRHLMHELVPMCSICQRPLEGHEYTSVAVACRCEVMTDLIRLFQSRKWKDLFAVNNWIGTSPALNVYLISGPHAEGMAICVRHPFELDEVDELYLSTSLSAAEVIALRPLIQPESWKPL
jgi:hypothetical protein